MTAASLARLLHARGMTHAANPAPRPLWTGAISFGIVSIPVRLFSAVRDHDLHFHQISRTEHRRIRYKKVAEGHDDEVEARDIVKGYPLPDGTYVILEDAELQKIASRKSRLIEIRDFVGLEEIDPSYFDKPYYLVPEEGAEKAYRLLAGVLERTSKVAIADVVMHGKEHLVAIRSHDGLLYLETMYFHDEIVPAAQLGLAHGPDARVTARELAMAEKLVESMTTRFTPEAYKDSYRERLNDYIEKKSHDKAFSLDEDEDDTDHEKVIDLMEALKRSLSQHGSAASGSHGASKKPSRRTGRRAS